MDRRPLSDETLDLALALHAGLLDLESIQDSELRDRVRELYEQLLHGAEPREEGDEHLPPWLVAGWPRISEALSELERSSIESHLGACENCREELLLLQETRVEASAPARPAKVMPGLWFTSSWALVATAALLLVWLRAPEAGPSRAGEFPTLTVPATLRSGAEPAELRIERGAEGLRIDLQRAYPAPLRAELVDSGVTGLWLEVRARASGEGRVVDEISIEEFSRAPSFTWTADPGESLVVGDYDCSVWLRSGDSARIDARFSFRVDEGGGD